MKYAVDEWFHAWNIQLSEGTSRQRHLVRKLLRFKISVVVSFHCTLHCPLGYGSFFFLSFFFSWNTVLGCSILPIRLRSWFDMSTKHFTR